MAIFGCTLTQGKKCVYSFGDDANGTILLLEKGFVPLPSLGNF
jgi:hypothetical protein